MTPDDRAAIMDIISIIGETIATLAVVCAVAWLVGRLL